MKTKKLTILLSILLIALIILFAGFYIYTRPQTEKGLKTISVTVIHKDKTENEFKINTDAEYLSDALFEKKLIDESEYRGDGMYTKIDGEKADYNTDNSWWCVTKDGEMTNVGIDELIIVNGDKYEITYTIS